MRFAGRSASFCPASALFKDAVRTLREKEFAGPIVEHINAGKPFLGICLGLQMLFDVGYEDGMHQGLGVLRGTCVRFDVDSAMGLKVPHMGWNQLNFKRPSPLLRDLQTGCNVYFVHSYHVVPEDESVIATTTDYGRPFVSSICRDNLMLRSFTRKRARRWDCRCWRISPGCDRVTINH